MARKPLVSSADWDSLYEDGQVEVYQDRANWAFYKVVTFVNDKKATKYFYGETAHHDVPRFLVDKVGDLAYWNVLYNT